MSSQPSPPPIHLHTYERSLTNKDIYRCVDPDCHHYCKRELIKDKRALCFKCHRPFILNWTQLKNFRPVCLFCSRSPKGKQVKELASVLEGIFDKTKTEKVEENK